MRWYSVLLLLVGLVAFAHSQSFFESLRNVFRPRRQNTFNSFNQPQQSNRFRPPQSQSGGFRPVQNSNQGFIRDVGLRENVNNNGFRPQQSSNNVFRPQQNNNNNNAFRTQQSNNNNGIRFKSANNQVSRPNNRPAAGGRPRTVQNKFINKPRNTNFNICAKHEAPRFCPPAEPNHYDSGTKKFYLLTWNITCPAGTPNCDCTKFTGDEAMEYCNSLPNARPISIDTPEKKFFAREISAAWAQRYYWSGARIQYPEQVIIWPNGKSETWVRGQGEWSHTGGARDKGPQPDNRNEVQDHCEPEFCIGVLNNFYADGIKWHDVACHHRKPTICEFD